MMENKDAELPNINVVRFVILQIRHIAPPVLYSNSPLSYIASGAAESFYQGEGEATNDGCDDPSVIVYWIVETTLQEVEDVPPRMLITNVQDEIELDSGEPNFIYGNKLIGYLPCSDSFGVDLILENYQKELAKIQELSKVAASHLLHAKAPSIKEGGEPINHKARSQGDRNELISKHKSNFSIGSPENLNDRNSLEVNAMDRSQRSSAGFNSTMPLRVTTKGEEIQLKEQELNAKELELLEREAEVRRLLGSTVDDKMRR
jgi:hypothetical protein